ncbi:MAG: DUF3108 domain-containing protein [Magnetococcales bacterium]|nr:DUF3108 domain-containing protein [Magnetococcales bacterium]
MQNIVFIQKSKPILALFIVTSLFLSTMFANNSMAANKYGALVGERLIYNVHWMGIPAGLATMKRNNASQGKYQLEATIQAAGMVKLLHNIRDTLRSDGNIIPEDKYQTVRYNKDQRSTKRVRQTDYQYNRANSIVKRHRKGENIKEIVLPSHEVNDPLAVFYTLRSLPELKPEHVYSFPTLHSKKVFPMQAVIGATTEKNTAMGWFDVIPVTLKIPKSGGLYSKEEAITIWLTADNRRLPLRVETRLSLGGVAADLVEYFDGNGGHGEIEEDMGVDD